MATIFETLGEQLRRVRRSRGLSQAGVAQRVGRDRARISEFERDLSTNRVGRDRLTLFAEICGALDLVPVVVPRARASEIRALVDAPAGEGPPRRSPSSAFDELFVDLDDDEEPS
jgi:transcriptional regulator with XRE-family HTH domain